MFWRNNRPEISLLQHDVAHITFSVRNGKALLRPCVIHAPDSDAGIHTLSWHVKRGELFKIDLQLIQDNQKRHNGELFKIKFAVV
ncbi:hypothetical protein C0Z77_09325 [Salmonella enterica]|nr:hypothetical protein [Salmonella enterica]